MSRRKVLSQFQQEQKVVSPICVNAAALFAPAVTVELFKASLLDFYSRIIFPLQIYPEGEHRVA